MTGIFDNVKSSLCMVVVVVVVVVQGKIDPGDLFCNQIDCTALHCTVVVVKIIYYIDNTTDRRENVRLEVEDCSDFLVALPAILCHKEPARSKQRPVGEKATVHGTQSLN